MKTVFRFVTLLLGLPALFIAGFVVFSSVFVGKPDFTILIAAATVCGLLGNLTFNYARAFEGDSLAEHRKFLNRIGGRFIAAVIFFVISGLLVYLTKDMTFSKIQLFALQTTTGVYLLFGAGGAAKGILLLLDHIYNWQGAKFKPEERTAWMALLRFGSTSG